MQSTVTKNTLTALLCRPIIPSIKTLVGALILVATTALPVLACGGGSEGAVILLAFPLGVAAIFYGLPLLLSLLIESAILHYQESVGWLKSFGLSLLVNIGGLVAVVFGTVISFGLPPFGFITLAFQGVILGLMLTTFCRRTGYFLGLTKGLGQIGVYILLLGMSYGSLALDRIVETSQEPDVLLPPIAGLLLIGFLFNLIVEGWILSLLMPKLRPQLASTVVSMNVWSYGILPASMLLSKYLQGMPLFS
ncbi:MULTISPECIES: hypothetical protein [Trichocoleus]|uniref:Uncharacterized protein n=1 Tax=Trichocoleus desertorum GB2-A4 TaxID=2933944 RepID=A0ABV0J8C1_9CYAN|nr:hypothetical protein [Trichocoleus sp. FACHB-46]MBD1861042.1 hypothetical protein [Trichocoleus sp. FACHB-46]